MRIRQAGLEDYDSVARLLLQIAALHHKLRPDIFRLTGSKYDLEQYKEMLKDKDRPILVAEKGGTALGYAMCVVVRHKDHPVGNDRCFLYVDDLCVDENCRGQGIGEALMTAVTDLARERNCGAIELNVWECNQGAREFYERLGYTTQRRGLEIKL